ncbi:MAG: hypothetical protein ACXV5Q_01110 [Frankiaceae bacterium]
MLAAVGARVRTVDVLAESPARQLLANLSGVPVGGLPAEVDRVLTATRRVALGLALVAAAVRGGVSWGRVADGLDRAGGTFLDHPYANTFKALQVATAAGSRTCRGLSELGGVSGQTPVFRSRQ